MESEAPRCSKAVMGTPSSKRKALTLAERVEVIKRLNAHESQISIAQDYGVHPSQISRILKNKDWILGDWQNNINPNRKRRRAGRAEDVEVALLRWFNQALSRQLPVTGLVLMAKANSFAETLGAADFKATVGWLDRWKERNGIKLKRRDGEKREAEDPNAAERWVSEVLPDIIKDFHPRDIFNADETGLYWRAVPELDFSDAPGNSKPLKERVTLLLVCNMDGSEKLEPLAIGRNRHPRCFKNVKRLPVAYEANESAWMTPDIWREWLQKTDRLMRARKREVALLVDNCTAHTDVDVKLTNMRLVFLPLNTSPLIQPMDQGIIATFKRHYRALVLRHVTGVVDTSDEPRQAAEDVARKLTLLDSLHLQKAAWDRVTSATIVNCYRRAGFAQQDADGGDEAGESEAGDDVSDDIDMPAGVTEDVFDRYVALDADLQTAADNTDVEICASVLAAADTDDNSDDGPKWRGGPSEEPVDVPGSPVTFATALQSLYIVRAYLEAAGCESYERFYALADQLYDTLK